MSHLELAHALERARAINLDASIYGTFAEIGAGQEVARHFFQAGLASQTVAKTISAYDMTFSDSIYGKAQRYVCADRVEQMLDHEYELLMDRLAPQRGATTRFFVLADTVATSTSSEPNPRCQGWMGVRFQSEPGAPSNTILIHVQMLDRQRLEQQEALGLLGVNLVHLAYHLPKSYREIPARLISDLGKRRVQIDCMTFSGPSLSEFDSRLISLEMIRSGVTDGVIFSAEGKMVSPSDVLFRRAVVLSRGNFRPVTTANYDLTQRGLTSLKTYLKPGIEALLLFEMTMSSLKQAEGAEEADFLDRMDTLRLLGNPVLLSNHDLYYGTKGFLRRYTDQPLAIMIGASHLERIFDHGAYRELPGGMLEGFSRLVDPNTKIFVHPVKSSQGQLTASRFKPAGATLHLYQFLRENGVLVDIAGGNESETTIHSRDVREMLSKGDPSWEKHVPKPVAEAIRSRQLFGFRGS